jgi:DNA repair protein RecO (recombination protein O)
MLYKTRGIVFHQIKYSETSIITKIYTELFGLQTYIVKGVRKKKSKIKTNIFQHLSLVDMVVYHKEKRGIQYLKEIRPCYQFISIPFDIKKGSIILFINEILYKSIREQEANKELFDFIFSSVKTLDMAKEKISDFHLYFMMQLTKYLGFYPTNNYSDKYNIFNLKQGIFQKNFTDSYCISKEISQKLSELLDSSLKIFQYSSNFLNCRKELLEQLIKYYQFHISGFNQTKSNRVLETVFN